MAEEYYTLAETAEKLGKKEEEIEALVKSGQLKPLEGPELIFRAEEVDRLAKEMAGKETMGMTGGEGTEDLKIVEETSGEKESDISDLGLLDLNKVPDATAFGGELDKIFEAEVGPTVTPSEEGTPVPGKEGEKIGIEAEVAEPEVPAIVSPQRIEEEIHPISNWIMMFTALAAVIFGLIIAIAGSRGFTPGLLVLTKGIFWRLFLGAIGLVLVSWSFPKWVFPLIVSHMQAVAKAKAKKGGK